MTRQTPRSARIAERADDAARWTGIPALLDRLGDGRQPRFRLRWLAVATLATATAGFASILARPDRHWMGYGLLMAGFAVGNMLPLFGPVKPWGLVSGVDERDREVRRNAYFFTFAAISAVAVLGLYTMIGCALLGGWDAERLCRTMSAMGFYLMTLWSSVPTLHASWAVRPIADD